LGRCLIVYVIVAEYKVRKHLDRKQHLCQALSIVSSFMAVRSSTTSGQMAIEKRPSPLYQFDIDI